MFDKHPLLLLLVDKHRGYIRLRMYMEEARLVDVRLNEQLQSGTITIENGCVKLTKRGDWLASTSRFFRLHLLPRRRLLAGEYTDVLVDPFAESHSGPMGYECK